MTQAHSASQLPPAQRQQSLPEIPGLQVLDKIGQGGMASVYLALQESLQRPVAVKILSSPDTPGFHERFLNEGRYIAALSHSNILDVHDVGECNGHYYIVMEYLPGGDLKERIRKGMKPKDAMDLAIRIAGCLDYLHQQGIVHRDLKPANILFRGDGNPVITDFGIAKILQQSVELTVCGAVMGSPYYLSPEQANSSEAIDGRSDLYSLGIIIYEMLTGEHPFKGDNFTAILLAHREEPIPLLPDDLMQYQPIIDQLLPKSPDQRYQNGQELIEDIHDLFTQEVHDLGDTEYPNPVGIEPIRPSHRRKPNDRLHFGGGGRWLMWLLLIGLLTAAAGYTLQQQQNQAFMTLQEKVFNWLHSNIGPDLFPQDKPRQGEVSHLIRLGNDRLEAVKLSYPLGDSALHYFREALKLHPDSREARQGISEILHWYIEQAEQAIRDGDLQQAARYISRGSSIDKSHPRLMALHKQLHPSRD